MDEGCPIGKIIKVLGMKWNLLILRQLNGDFSKRRFNQLLEELRPISTRTLSKRLKELENTGLINKERFNETPPRVDYSLTKSGKEIIRCFAPLTRWAEKFGNTI